MSTYNIWNKEKSIPSISELEKVKAEHITIKPFEPEKDGYIFLHGPAITKFKGRMYCAWAHNKECENSDAEEVNYSVSDDDGLTWSECIKGNLAPEKGIAVSHGSFLVHMETLYFFAPMFKGQLGAEMLKMCVWKLDEENEKFCYLGIASDERFWPMCEPVLMENGNYIMPGIYVGESYTSPDNTAAVAISHGNDVLHWDVIKMEKGEGVNVWGECTVTVNESNCKMYCREHSRKLKALYCESNDYGNTWNKLDMTDLPMTDSKPYAGILSDGRTYLICSSAEDISERTPLTIALTEKNDDKFSRIFNIRSGGALSYPYAVEIDKKLYIAYSLTTEGFNRNSAELAIIDIGELK